MAKRNIHVRASHYGADEVLMEANVDLGLEEGDVIKRGGTGGNFGVHVQDGDGEGGVDIMLGVTKSANSATAAANGAINVEFIGPGTKLSGRANNAVNINTEAKLLGIRNDFVCFDRSADTPAGVLTIDEDEGDDPNVHGLFILGGDIVKGTLEVYVAEATIFNSIV